MSLSLEIGPHLMWAIIAVGIAFAIGRSSVRTITFRGDPPAKD